MATISKFYLLDATSPNTGTLPSNSPTTLDGGVAGAGTEATGASTARDATDVPGTSNPDIESSITSAATLTLQRLGHRRFVSRPMAAATLAAADGNWTFSYARSENNLLHNMSMVCRVYFWRPGTGLRVGTGSVGLVGTEPASASTETAESITAALSSGPTSINDGDIIVFDIFSAYTQGMSTAYTDQFAYNGTTEASTTTCASFVTPPAALTLFTPSDYTGIRDRRSTSRRGTRTVRV